MNDPLDIIARCTRNGTTSWQHVARQLGRSVDSVRAQFDHQYLHVRPWAHPCEEVASEPSTPHPKDEPARSRILRFVGKHPSSAHTIAARLALSVSNVKVYLSTLKAAGLVQPITGSFPYTWALTDAGLAHIKDIGRINASVAGRAA